MKVFVWVEVKKCSNNYHSNGGVVVFACDEGRAGELANAEHGCEIRHDEAPDDVRDVVGGEERVFVMPNAGCC